MDQPKPPGVFAFAQPLIPLVPLITAIVSVAGFLWGVLQYTATQERTRADRQAQSLREEVLSEREFMKPWLESQRSIYLEALNAAATAANAGDPKDRKAALQNFWELYHGRMILVETKSVASAMVQFGNCVNRESACAAEEYNARTRALASAMAESMAATAKMTYREFATNQFRYLSGP